MDDLTQETQSSRKTSVEHASNNAKCQTKDTPHLRRKVRQIAVDLSEILENSTEIFGKVEHSTE
eukprot:scaffold5517_cov116-Isochrysis_galbana.AAC.6